MIANASVNAGVVARIVNELAQAESETAILDRTVADLIVRKGRLLTELRTALRDDHGAFTSHLKELKIDPRNARNWMRRFRVHAGIATAEKLFRSLHERTTRDTRDTLGASPDPATTCAASRVEPLKSREEILDEMNRLDPGEEEFLRREYGDHPADPPADAMIQGVDDDELAAEDEENLHGAGLGTESTSRPAGEQPANGEADRWGGYGTRMEPRGGVSPAAPAGVSHARRAPSPPPLLGSAGQLTLDREYELAASLRRVAAMAEAGELSPELLAGFEALARRALHLDGAGQGGVA